MKITFEPEIGTGRYLNEIASSANWFFSNIFINHTSPGRDFMDVILQ
jgi:hypothetical protein